MPKTPYRIRLFTVAAAFVGLLSAGCSSDSYDTGDGNYSYLTADFALVTTDASAALVAASTDDGASLSFDRPYKAGWTAKPDTVYRALVYYDKKPTEKVALRAVTQIPVMAVHKPEDVKEMTDAPLGVEGVW